MRPLSAVLLILLLTTAPHVLAEEPTDRSQQLKEAIERLANTIKAEAGQPQPESEKSRRINDRLRQLARAIAIRHKLKVPQVRMYTLIDLLAGEADIHQLMRSLTLRDKGGLGLGPKPGAITPDGFEAKLEILKEKPLSTGQLESQGPHLEKAAYLAAAVGLAVGKVLAIREIDEASRKNRKVSHEEAELADGMAQAALEFAGSVKRKEPEDIKSHAAKLSETCRACHDRFRKEELASVSRVREWITELRAPNPSQKAFAARRLGQWKVHEAIPELIESLKNSYKFVQEESAEALRVMNVRIDPPFPILNEALKREDAYVYFWFVHRIGEYGDHVRYAVPELLLALRHEDVAIRAKALEILACLGVEAGSALPQLNESLKDPDAQVRLLVVRALVRIDQKNAIPSLVEALHDPSAVVRGRAALALIETGSVALPILIKTLKDDNADARGSAAYALGRLGPPARKALPALRKALKDDDPIVRNAAVEAVRKIGDDGKMKKKKKLGRR